MKYGLGIKLLVSFMVGGFAVLHKIKLNPKTNQSESSVVVNVPKYFLLNYIIEPKNVPKYFSWIPKWEEIDKRKNMSEGKGYKGLLDFPFLGQHQIRYYISDVDPSRWIVFKPDPIRGSYFNPEVICMFNSIGPTETHFHIKIIYHKQSALFQLTLGRWLKSVTDTQLERLTTLVNKLVMNKWKIWQNTSTKSKYSANSTINAASITNSTNP